MWMSEARILGSLILYVGGPLTRGVRVSYLPTLRWMRQMKQTHRLPFGRQHPSYPVPFERYSMMVQPSRQILSEYQGSVDLQLLG